MTKLTKFTDQFEFEIAPGFTNKDWHGLNLDTTNPHRVDWQTAIDKLQARITERFIGPADELVRLGGVSSQSSRQRFGFAILALDFVVLETIQGFRAGLVDHTGRSKDLVTNFLRAWPTFQSCIPEGSDPIKIAHSVYKDIRCALHHSGATAVGLKVSISGPTFEFRDGHLVKINRTSFHERLKDEFTDYLNELKQLDKTEMLENFKGKMNGICGTTKQL